MAAFQISNNNNNRQMLSNETIENNAKSISQIIQKFISFTTGADKSSEDIIVNNNNNKNNFSKYKYRRNINKKDKKGNRGLDLDKIKEISVLRSMDKRPVFPPDMLWEIWWFIPRSVKQTFVTSRISYLIKIFITSIDRLWLYSKGKLYDMICAIPTEKLLKFIKFGSPAKYYIKPTHRTEDTLCEHITSSDSETWHLRFDIMFNLINMIVGAYDENRIPTMVALINAIIHIHRKYAKEGVVFESILY